MLQRKAQQDTSVLEKLWGNGRLGLEYQVVSNNSPVPKIL
jgi:hypothetical protein